MKDGCEVEELENSTGAAKQIEPPLSKEEQLKRRLLNRSRVTPTTTTNSEPFQSIEWLTASHAESLTAQTIISSDELPLENPLATRHLNISRENASNSALSTTLKTDCHSSLVGINVAEKMNLCATASQFLSSLQDEISQNGGTPPDMPVLSATETAAVNVIAEEEAVQDSDSEQEVEIILTTTERRRTPPRSLLPGRASNSAPVKCRYDHICQLAACPFWHSSKAHLSTDIIADCELLFSPCAAVGDCLEPRKFAFLLLLLITIRYPTQIPACANAALHSVQAFTSVTGKLQEYQKTIVQRWTRLSFKGNLPVYTFGWENGSGKCEKAKNWVNVMRLSSQ